MKRLLALILAVLLCTPVIPINAAETGPYSYNAYSNALFVAGESVVLDNADELSAALKENEVKLITVTSGAKAKLDLSISSAVLDILAEKELSLKILAGDATLIAKSETVKEISDNTDTSFTVSADGTEGVKASFAFDGTPATFANAMTAIYAGKDADINNVVSNGTSVGMVYINGKTWYIPVKGDVDAKATTTAAPEFTDINNHWGKDSINYVASKGYFNGVEPTKFKPDNRMTRAMVVTVLSRIDGAADLGARYTFTDVNATDWYSNGVSWAFTNKIVEGSESFRPNEDVTRLELMEMLYNYAKVLGVATVNEKAKEFVFVDYDLVTTDLAKEAVSFCTSNGIVNGYSIGDGSTHRLRPAGQATRAEVAAMIQRFADHATKSGYDLGDIMGTYSDFITVRSDLKNTYNKLVNGEEVVVSYFGGSITAGFGSSSGDTSWRGLTFNWLKNNFPNAKLVHNAVAMGGSGSHLGAFRVGYDVIDPGTDLLFIEFSVNDNYSGTTAAKKVELYFESIVRQVREALPECDIIALYTTDSGLVQKHGEGTMHPSAASQDAVCEHYGVTSIDVGRALARHMGGYNSSWSTYFKDSVHPLDPGYKVFADAITEYMGEYLLGAQTLGYGGIEAYTIPEGYVDARNETFKPIHIAIDSEEIFDEIKGYTFVKGGVFFDCTKTRGYIFPSEEDNSFTFTFEGTALDMYLEYSGGGYVIEYSVDGGETKKMPVSNTNHPFKLVDNLEYGKHTITYSYKGTSTSRKIGALMVSGQK